MGKNSDRDSYRNDKQERNEHRNEKRENVFDQVTERDNTKKKTSSSKRKGRRDGDGDTDSDSYNDDKHIQGDTSNREVSRSRTSRSDRVVTRKKDSSKKKRRHRSDDYYDNDDDESDNRKLQKRSKTSSSTAKKRHSNYNTEHVHNEDEDIDGANKKNSSTKRKHKHSRKSENKDHRSKKSKKSKKSKSERRSRNNESSIDTQKSIGTMNVDESKLFSLGESLGHKPERLLDVEQDYYAFHQHFWLYLFRRRRTAFNDLTSDQAREAFKDFAKEYNAGLLANAYYSDKGLPLEALDEIQTSQHKWGFQISDRESKSLQALQLGVRKQTEYSKETDTRRVDDAIISTDAGREVVATNDDTKSKPMVDKRAQRVADSRLRDNVLTSVDEMIGGKKDGRERLMEKRKEIGTKIHGASRDREDSAVGPALTDDIIYGSTDSDFQSALAAQKRRKQQQEEKQRARFVELQAKEDEKKVAMLKSLGLLDKIKPGERIQIKPRDDT